RNYSAQLDVMVKHKDTETQRHRESRHQTTFVCRLSLCLCVSVSLCLTTTPRRMLNSYPQFNDTPTLRMSESKLQRKLHDPWILGSKNPAEAGVLGRRDASWTETVGDVKGFCPNLHTLSFVHPEFPR